MSQTLTIPAGYELDLENSTSTNVVLKKVEKLPNTWAEVRQIEGYYLLCGEPKHHLEWARFPMDHKVGDQNNKLTDGVIAMDTPVFATKEQAEAMQALAKLTHLVKMYNGDWEYKDPCTAYKICYSLLQEDFSIGLSRDKSILFFQKYEKAELFLKNFKDLIIQAKPLIL